MHCEPMYTVELEYGVCVHVSMEHSGSRQFGIVNSFVCGLGALYAHNSPTTVKRKSALVSC